MRKILTLFMTLSISFCLLAKEFEVENRETIQEENRISKGLYLDSTLEEGPVYNNVMKLSKIDGSCYQISLKNNEAPLIKKLFLYNGDTLIKVVAGSKGLLLEGENLKEFKKMLSANKKIEIKGKKAYYDYFISEIDQGSLKSYATILKNS